jgi:hypothetical protein
MSNDRYDVLREVILKEIVLSTYRRKLKVLLAERENRSLEQISSMAEKYEQTHLKSVSSVGAVRPLPTESRRVGGESKPDNRNHHGDGKVRRDHQVRMPP